MRHTWSFKIEYLAWLLQIGCLFQKHVLVIWWHFKIMLLLFYICINILQSEYALLYKQYLQPQKEIYKLANASNKEAGW